jgi:starvation-inducible DNA-binding protein
MHKTKNDLPLKKRTEVTKLLNERLADLIDLKLQTKQAHWNVRGPHFIALHELFDKVASAVDEHVDVVAERIGALGGIAEGTLKAVSDRTSLSAYKLDISSGRDHVEALSSALAAAGKEVRAAIDKADSIGDADTADIFTAVSRTLDHYLWFVEAHLQADK